MPNTKTSDETTLTPLVGDEYIRVADGGLNYKTTVQDLANFNREKLTANRTYYVRTDGSNSNTGLVNNAGGAFLTIQHAVDVVCHQLDLDAYSATIRVADGTYDENLRIGPVVSSYRDFGFPVQLIGNTSNPANVVIRPTANLNYGTVLLVYDQAFWLIEGFKYDASAATNCSSCIIVQERAMAFMHYFHMKGPANWAPTYGIFVQVGDNSFLECGYSFIGNCVIEGGAGCQCLYYVSSNSYVHDLNKYHFMNDLACTYTYVAVQYGSRYDIEFLPYYSAAGAVTLTGKRFELNENSSISCYQTTADTATIPGSTTGTVDNSSKYLGTYGFNTLSGAPTSTELVSGSWGVFKNGSSILAAANDSGTIRYVGTPGGSNTQVQFNDSGVFGGDADFTWDKTNNALTIGVAASTKGLLKLTGNTSGTVTVQPAAAAGTWSMTLPTTGGTNGYFLQTNGSGVTTWAAASTAPAGSDMQIQYNNSGAFAGTAGLEFNYSNLRTFFPGSVFLTNGNAYVNGETRIQFVGTDIGAFGWASGGIDLDKSLGIKWSSVAFGLGSEDTGLHRNAAGVVEVNNGTAGTYRDLKLRRITSIVPSGVGTALDITVGQNETVLSVTSSFYGPTWIFKDFGHPVFVSGGSYERIDFGIINLGGNPNVGNAITIDVSNSNNVGNLAWSNGSPSTTAADIGICRNAAGVLEVNNGTAGTLRWLVNAGQKRVSTQFDKTSNTTLGNITGLSVDVIAGRTYQFKAKLFTTSNIAGGVQAAIAGTATATAIIYQGTTTSSTTIGANDRATALATAVGAITAVTAATIDIEGLITVNAAGTLTVQFAQNVSNGSASSVLVGSYFIVQDVL